MNGEFNAEEFFRKMQDGLFDGRLCEEIGRLSREQLEHVAVLLARHLNANSASGG